MTLLWHTDDAAFLEAGSHQEEVGDVYYDSAGFRFIGDEKTGSARNVRRIGHVVRDAGTSAGVDRVVGWNSSG
jgi:hypothetical protein